MTMEGPSFEIPPFEFDDLDLNYDADSPNQSNDPTRFGGQGAGRVDAESDEGESAYDSFPFPYTITWKLHLRKGRLTKLTEDTIEDVQLAPSIYWSEILESELATLVTSRLPEPGYQPDETLITVSTSKRGEPSFLKRFDKLSINWMVVENKLESWCNRGSNLKVAISFIYKETWPPNRDGKTGRGATKKHSAALGRLVAQQEASGTRAVWRDVYQLMECSSAACVNRGFSCWRYDDKHYKLDSDIMERLVDFAEEGHKLETHADVPQEIREVIFARKEEEETRRLRKRKASEPLPVNIRVFCHERRDEASPDSTPESENQAVQIDFPVPEDKAPVQYSEWLSARITNQAWQDASRLAGQVAVDKGYDLHWLFSHQKAGKEMLIENGVLEGVAARFVSWVQRWADDTR
ncbi:hypothetical protein F5Y16DRAFT_202129 [Xylariaceae sp. FL0255]|nr:hypothetical protein F5Y16DRAFT_202129 [Xylariaceae sp. FL0255]